MNELIEKRASHTERNALDLPTRNKETNKQEISEAPPSRHGKGDPCSVSQFSGEKRPSISRWFVHFNLR